MPPRLKTFAQLRNSIAVTHYNQRQHAFSSSSDRSASAREPTLYEVLDVPVTATTSEIKKQFYSLSLRHHPDRNPRDPTATSRFARISSAYHILSNEAKRRTYDRDHGIHSSLPSTHSSAHPMGSYSSYSANLHTKQGASYAGSRPASGLSKRRSAFRGPPPSFYRHGGYGRTGRTASSANGYGHAQGAGRGGAARGATSDPEDATAFVDRNPVSHFNARGHFRTQSAEDERREARRARARRVSAEEMMRTGGHSGLRFVAVCAILVGTGLVTALFPGAR
ncbi:hypothetical protein MAP00_001835 [Monascus purpureus]|nr:hypothetical protein MAP00_001835 [Monascus purpureus]